MRYRHLPPLNALRYFEAAARLCNFTQAATELNVTPSAISHQIRSLESYLGQRLFQRNRQTLFLTKIGQEYLRTVRDILDHLEVATEEAIGKPIKETIVLSVSPAFASRWLVKRIKSLNNKHPHINIHINSARHHVDFEKENVDIAIRHGTGDWPGLKADLLIDDELFPACSPMLFNGSALPTAYSDIARYPLLNDVSHSYWREWLALVGVADVQLDNALSFDDNGLIIDAAVLGYGIAMVRSALVEEELKSGRLIRLFNISLRDRLGYYVVCPELTAYRPSVKLVRRWLLSEAHGNLQI
ncbi:LysR family glycine cleavage system transcriptional activator [Azospirillum lipoferum]|uniref:Transcriptional regulator GcvA n=1 Tax=Azospirillum lipoferum TaxID=193 RepID=A0A5A9FUL1_AZOLI|nr:MULTISPECIES: transcriptional regulator GcvA [Azospirillum]KAA0585687.1 transcriptional regulator GcvA [Azospirillum lipoferum]MCP1614823.1 LysR family glycine cleavage system transcriptional activator [Azospirillum lipoferum]MDW5532277.1 transcriptional regulator GcvA [Azospirillum sp. NL1]